MTESANENRVFGQVFQMRDFHFRSSRSIDGDVDNKDGACVRAFEFITPVLFTPVPCPACVAADLSSSFDRRLYLVTFHNFVVIRRPCCILHYLVSSLLFSLSSRKSRTNVNPV